MKINGNEITLGNLLDHKSDIFRVVKVQHVKPGKGGAFAQVELKSIRTGQKLNERFRADEKVDRARVDQVQFQFLYGEKQAYTFMNTENFEQITLQKDFIGEHQTVYLDNPTQKDIFVEIEFYDDKPIGLKIPEKVICLVVEADAVVKGQTASSSYKPAKLENGLTILVPPHIYAGTKVIVSTSTTEYVERVKE